MDHLPFALSLLFICTQTNSSTITTCSDIWNGFTRSQKLNSLLIKTDIYTLANNVSTRCSFVDLGNDMLFVGAMSEYGSRDSHQTDLNCPMFRSCPFNEYDLETAETTKLYRWSLDRMISYRNKSIAPSFDDQSYLLLTCNMDLTVTRDYMLMQFNEDFVTKAFSAACYQIKQANIRGYECENNVANFWNRDSQYHFHIDSSHCLCGGCCSWQTGSVSSEDNFGYYRTINPSFSCTTSSTSTTEYWIGSILNFDLSTDEPTMDPTTDPSSHPTQTPTHHIPSNVKSINESACRNLATNTGLIYGSDLDECIDICGNMGDLCRMINYYYYFKSTNDSRCYIFDDICDVISNDDHTTEQSIIYYKTQGDSCAMYPYDWVDSIGDNCNIYKAYNWCTDGHALRNEDEFTNLMDTTYGESAIDACCQCGGGAVIMDNVPFSVDQNWTNHHDDILCNDYPSDIFQLEQTEQLRQWDNLLLYELCDLYLDVDCAFLIDSQWNSNQYSYSIHLCDRTVTQDDGEYTFRFITELSTLHIKNDSLMYDIVFDMYINLLWFDIEPSYYSTSIILLFIMLVLCWCV
eukprot:690753_1